MLNCSYTKKSPFPIVELFKPKCKRTIILNQNKENKTSYWGKATISYVFTHNIVHIRLCADADDEKSLHTIKDIQVHEKEYVFLFTKKSIPRGCWTLAKTYDNVHIIKEKSLYRKMNIPEG